MPVAWARSHPCARRSARRSCRRSAPVAPCRRPRMASLEDPGRGESCQQRSYRGLISPDRVVAEVVGSLIRRGAAVDQGCKRQIHRDQVIDNVADVPFRARRRRLPLIGADRGGHIADGLARTREILRVRGLLPHGLGLSFLAQSSVSRMREAL
jgi:hypothetical protein